MKERPFYSGCPAMRVICGLIIFLVILGVIEQWRNYPQALAWEWMKGQARGSVFTDPIQYLREKHTHTQPPTHTPNHTHTHTHPPNHPHTHTHTHPTTHTHTHTHTYCYSLGALEFRQYQYWYLFFDGLDNWSGKYIACVMSFFISGNDCRESAPCYLKK
jgi:hypothetical protein